MMAFQPFLRFYNVFTKVPWRVFEKVSTLLEILLIELGDRYIVAVHRRFQPFLRFYTTLLYSLRFSTYSCKFQPFLRFYIFLTESTIIQHGEFQPFLRFYYSTAS